MKLSIAALLISSAAAFVPATQPAFTMKALSMSNVVTGPKGKPASSKEEDLELTLKVIFGGNDESEEPAAKSDDAEKED